MKRSRLVTLALSTLALTCVASRASAAPPWNERHLTLPTHHWSFDVGIGVEHSDEPNPTLTGPGLNFEFAVSVIDKLELGLRSGVRLSDEARLTSPTADEPARLFDRETFGTVNDIFANPEFHIRGQLVRHRVVELALEGRAYLPIEQASRFGPASQFGVMFGVPLMFHAGHIVRIDTGIYTPIVFYNRTYYAFDLPVAVWFQASPRVWLGPMGGLRFEYVNDAPRNGPTFERTSIPFGFGLGVQLASWCDMKTMAYFPNVNRDQGARDWGLGFGFQFRIE